MTRSMHLNPISTHSRRTLRIAAVSYLNARPLIYGLDQIPDNELLLEVPAGLIDLLREDRADIALLPVIDYQRMPNLCIVPSGGIGCDGETLTVRIFSKVPIEQIHKLRCDIESHTSVALARIVLAEHFGIRPEFVGEGGTGVGCRASGVGESKSGFGDRVSGIAMEENQEDGSGPRDDRDTALLLIGDKVVCEEPAGFEHQLDLGDAWKKMTGMPFVFAAWMTRIGTDLGDLPEQLTHAKQSGLAHVEELIARHALPRGWPVELARQYLSRYLKYDIDEPQLAAIRLFHQLALKHEIISEQQPMRIYKQPNP